MKSSKTTILTFSRSRGQRLSKEQRELAKQQLFQLHIIAGVPLVECATMLGLNRSTLQQMKAELEKEVREKLASELSSDLLALKYLARLEAARQELIMLLATEGLTTKDHIRILREMRHVDKDIIDFAFQIGILQKEKSQQAKTVKFVWGNHSVGT